MPFAPGLMKSLIFLLFHNVVHSYARLCTQPIRNQSKQLFPLAIHDSVNRSPTMPAPQAFQFSEFQSSEFFREHHNSKTNVISNAVRTTPEAGGTACTLLIEEVRASSNYTKNIVMRVEILSSIGRIIIVAETGVPVSIDQPRREFSVSQISG